MATKEQLIAHMESRPDKQIIWLNAEGDWMNHKHKDFPIEKTRAEILGSKTDTETKKTQKVKQTNNEKDS